MTGKSFETVSVGAAQRDLRRLVGAVVGSYGRVQVSAGEGATAVLISKTELDALEQALAVLSDAGQVTDMCQALSQLASRTGWRAGYLPA